MDVLKSKQVLDDRNTTAGRLSPPGMQHFLCRLFIASVNSSIKFAFWGFYHVVFTPPLNRWLPFPIGMNEMTLQRTNVWSFRVIVCTIIEDLIAKYNWYSSLQQWEIASILPCIKQPSSPLNSPVTLMWRCVSNLFAAIFLDAKS